MLAEHLQHEEQMHPEPIETVLARHTERLSEKGSQARAVICPGGGARFMLLAGFMTAAGYAGMNVLDSDIMLGSSSGALYLAIEQCLNICSPSDRDKAMNELSNHLHGARQGWSYLTKMSGRGGIWDLDPYKLLERVAEKTGVGFREDFSDLPSAIFPVTTVTSTRGLPRMNLQAYDTSNIDESFSAEKRIRAILQMATASASVPLLHTPRRIPFGIEFDGGTYGDLHPQSADFSQMIASVMPWNSRIFAFHQIPPHSMRGAHSPNDDLYITSCPKKSPFVAHSFETGLAGAAHINNLFLNETDNMGMLDRLNQFATWGTRGERFASGAQRANEVMNELLSYWKID